MNMEMDIDMDMDMVLVMVMDTYLSRYTLEYLPKYVLVFSTVHLCPFTWALK